MGDEVGPYLFYHAATVACDGAMTLTRRYAQVCRDKAALPETTPERK